MKFETVFEIVQSYGLHNDGSFVFVIAGPILVIAGLVIFLARKNGKLLQFRKTTAAFKVLAGIFCISITPTMLSGVESAQNQIKKYHAGRYNIVEGKVTVLPSTILYLPAWYFFI